MTIHICDLCERKVKRLTWVPRNAGVPAHIEGICPRCWELYEEHMKESTIRDDYARMRSEFFNGGDGSKLRVSDIIEVEVLPPGENLPTNVKVLARMEEPS